MEKHAPAKRFCLGFVVIVTICLCAVNCQLKTTSSPFAHLAQNSYVWPGSQYYATNPWYIHPGSQFYHYYAAPHPTGSGTNGNQALQYPSFYPPPPPWNYKTNYYNYIPMSHMPAGQAGHAGPVATTASPLTRPPPPAPPVEVEPMQGGGGGGGERTLQQRVIQMRCTACIMMDGHVECQQNGDCVA